MGIYEELKERGLIAQVTDEAVIRELINGGKAVFYIGFDWTADCLHVGHFMALSSYEAACRWQATSPIALIGGGTAMHRRPYRAEAICERCSLPRTIQSQLPTASSSQMSQIYRVRRGQGADGQQRRLAAQARTNVDLLRDVGACFSVNNMLRAECYKQRMEKGLSFLEFNYMIMQSYDFYLSATPTTAAICSSAATISGQICSAEPSLSDESSARTLSAMTITLLTELQTARRWARPQATP